MPGVPQPTKSRMVPFSGHPAVVGIVPGQSELVALTAIEWARTVGGAGLEFAYVDPERVVVEELPDGTVRHTGADPDAVDDRWQATEARMRAELAALLDGTGLDWRFHYLAGRPDRALTHLARAVDAAVFVVGARSGGAGHRVAEFFAGSVAAHLAHHQHRPVLTVPVAVVDWADAEHPWRDR